MHKSKTPFPAPQRSQHELKNFFLSRENLPLNESEQLCKYNFELLQTIIDTIPVMICVFDPSINIYLLNQAFFNISGWRPQEIEHRDIMEVCYPDPAIRKKVKDYMLFLTPGWKEFPFTLKDGTVIETEWANIRLSDKRSVGIGIDIRCRKTAMESVIHVSKLRSFAFALADAEQEHKREVADLIHNNLQQLMIASSLRLSQLRKKLTQQEHIQLLDKSYELIQKSVSEARKLSIDLSPPILAHGSLKNTLEWLTGWMKENYELQIETQLAEIPNIPLKLTYFLYDCIKEVLFNTFKHSGTKKAILQLNILKNKQFQITISDSGCGCNLEQMEQIIKKGAEFGIFSIKERTRMFGGKITINSVPGHGFTVQMTYPFPSSCTEPEESENHPLLPFQKRDKHKSIRIIVADDHQIVREGLVNILKEEGFQIAGEAANGKEAIELTQEIFPDVLIMDINMPVLNGIEATRKIKALYPQITVIALSVNNDQNTIQEMQNAGCDFYLTKDQASTTLCQMIRELTQKRFDEQLN